MRERVTIGETREERPMWRDQRRESKRKKKETPERRARPVG